jgi:hypothetical protein
VTFSPTGTKVFTPYATIYDDSRWNNPGSGPELFDTGFAGAPVAGQIRNPGPNKDVMLLDLGTKIAVNKNVSIDTYYEVGRNWRQPTGTSWDDGIYELNFAASM